MCTFLNIYYNFLKIFSKIKKGKSVWALSVLSTTGRVGNTATCICPFSWFSCLNLPVHFNVSAWPTEWGYSCLPRPRSPEGMGQSTLFSTYCGSLPWQAPDHTCPQCRYILHPSSGRPLLLSAKTKHIFSAAVRLLPILPVFTALREQTSGAPAKQRGGIWAPQGNATCAINSLPAAHAFHAATSSGKTGTGSPVVAVV